jgi:hypothetical protein
MTSGVNPPSWIDLGTRSSNPASEVRPAWDNGFYKHQLDVHVGLRRHAQIWSVMGLCQEFYKEAWRDVGFTSLETLSGLKTCNDACPSMASQ